MKPLNGEKTHPLTPYAIGVLRQLQADGPAQRYTLNPGVLNRLRRGSFIESAGFRLAPRKGRPDASVEFFRITDAGRQAILDFQEGTP